MQRQKYSRVWIVLCLMVTAGLIETCSLAPATPAATSQPAINNKAHATKQFQRLAGKGFAPKPFSLRYWTFCGTPNLEELDTREISGYYSFAAQH